MRRVAELAGVSTMTVSRFFNRPDALSPVARARVEQAIEQLHYVPNAAARSLTSGRSETIALVLGDISNPFFTTLARGVEEVLQDRDLTLLLGNSDETLARERRYLNRMLERRVDGLILTPAPGGPHHRQLEQLAQHGIPVVLVDRRLEGAELDVVRGDSYEGGKLLAQHLIELGHERIAFVGGGRDTFSIDERRDGYRDALTAAGLPADERTGGLDRAAGIRIVEEMLGPTGPSPVTAIIAANNQLAAGAVQALRRRGQRIPADISLACFDDFEAETMVDPFLTFVRQPGYEIGRRATERLLARIDGDDSATREQVLEVELVPRRSTRRRAPSW